MLRGQETVEIECLAGRLFARSLRLRKAGGLGPP